METLKSHGGKSESIWTYIKADQFFATYLPQIKSYKHKIRGKNGRGNPTEFSEAELKEINKAIKKLMADLLNQGTGR